MEFSGMSQREGGDISYRDMMDEEALDSPIKNFFEGKTIFVTGATGFMGKILIEKLLRSSPNISKIFVLARVKKGKDIKERFREQFADVLYDLLRKQQPHFQEKFHFVSGDIGCMRLGLSNEDYDLITKETDIIFHGAATVKFDERLTNAVHINVRGTRELLKLAKSCTKLISCLHISTAFSNCVMKEIEEKFYYPPIIPDKLIDIVDSLDEEMVHKMTPILLGDYPNTYAYTKMVAEYLVKEISDGLPVAMFRPSIIVGTSREPLQGWIDNVYGPTGVVLGAGIGLLRTLHCDANNIAEIVPVDYVVNAAIVAAYAVAKSDEIGNKEQPVNMENGWEDCGPKQVKQVPIYNYVSSNQAPITWGTFMRAIEMHGFNIPSLVCIWYYCFTLNKHWLIHNIYDIFLQRIPGFIVDFILVILGKKPMMVKAYQKIGKFSNVISYFSTQEWKFHNKNTQNLQKIMSPGDVQLFDFDISHLDWTDFLGTYIKGLRVYLVKDPMDTVEAAKKRYVYFKLAHHAIFYFFCASLAYCSWKMVNGVASLLAL